MTAEPIKITHTHLVQRAVTWLRNTHRCSVVMAELRTANQETPDAIGWHGAGRSILIECKCSRADFFADGNKTFRQLDELGMGDVRYYMAPINLLTESDLPTGWGLLEVGSAHFMRQKVDPIEMTSNKRNEIKMLMSSIRRLELSTAVFVRHDPFEDVSGMAL